MKRKDEIEVIAEYLHIIWSNWFKYQLKYMWKPSNLLRWLKQSKTSYCQLSEKDKDKDRKLAIDLLNYKASEKKYINK